MNLEDRFGHKVSGATPEGLAQLERGRELFLLFHIDPLAAADAAIAAAPAMPMGYILKSWLLALSTEPGALPPAREAFLAALRLPATRREAGHLRALGLLLEGRWHEAARALLEVNLEFPHDTLALQAGHQLDFFTGEAGILRDRVARALAAWSEKLPGYHALLGMHAFGLEECGEYERAENEGRRAVEMEPRDSWAQHAVAHVMLMQGRANDGVAWMRANPAAWSDNSFFATHNWWHTAIFHLARGERDEVLRLYDERVGGPGSAVALELIDASQLLWRLWLLGIDVGDRWQGPAERWLAHAFGGNYAFNDVHALMAFVGAGRMNRAREVLEAQRAAMSGKGDNADFTREVGHPMAQGLIAFGEGRYQDCVHALRPLPPIARRFGGSHAQRQIIDLTLREAARRSLAAA